ncbi:MAG TPA: hypothetical protein VMJ32_19015 [Pirellulales bacterium]|nr:hypothetical protein [Pirellulales bacterium]
MDKLTVDPTTVAKLADLHFAVELCDASGQVLGWFQPAMTPEKYADLDVPFTDEELEAADNEEGGRTLKEILADLERRA